MTTLSTFQNFELIRELRERGLCIAYLEPDDISDHPAMSNESDATAFMLANRAEIQACMTQAGMDAFNTYASEDRPASWIPEKTKIL